MPGLEYRGSTTGNVVHNAVDRACDPTYYTTAKPGDPVKLNASGLIVKAATTDSKLLGVLAGRELLRENETPRVVKVFEDKNAYFEVKVASGTPVVGTSYDLNAAGELTSTTVNPPVKVYKPGPKPGTVYVTLNV